jgi:hypothetical protein
VLLEFLVDERIAVRECLPFLWQWEALRSPWPGTAVTP